MGDNRYFEKVNLRYMPIIFDFECRDEFFTNYLRFNAMYDKVNSLGITHLFIEELEDKTEKIIGFYTLKNSSLVLKELDNGQRIGYPAIEISQFAVAKGMERQGIGRIMIEDIVTTATDLAETSAIQYITACSIKDAIEFYIRMEFDEVGKDRFVPREQWNRECYPMARNIIMLK